MTTAIFRRRLAGENARAESRRSRHSAAAEDPASRDQPRNLGPAAVARRNSLRKLRGILQPTMSWDRMCHFQFQLGAMCYGSSELSAFSTPAATLANFRLRAEGAPQIGTLESVAAI